MRGTEKKYYNLTVAERRALLQSKTTLTDADMNALAGSAGLDVRLADRMIENVVGTYSLPLGIAQNFLINNKLVQIPMVVEEPSVVAGASFMARIIRSGGGFTAHASEPVMIGQMQLLDIDDLDKAKQILESNSADLLHTAGKFDPVLVENGGGPRGLEVRKIENSPIGPYLVVHWLVDVRDAMGANAVNTIVERMAPYVEELTGGRVLLRILTNLAVGRLATSTCKIPTPALAFNNYTGEQVRDGILEAYAFAASDPYRAATHNKGIMNGVDAVVLATANDWRAVEAGAHAYASLGGTYTSLTTWEKAADGDLFGKLEMPMAVGIIGGATRVHPTARAALKVMGVKTAGELAEIIVSVGLAQNLAALRALATEGIQRGHMGLHARQVALSAGAKPEQVDEISRQMVNEKKINSERAIEIIKGLDQ